MAAPASDARKAITRPSCAGVTPACGDVLVRVGCNVRVEAHADACDRVLGPGLLGDDLELECRLDVERANADLDRHGDLVASLADA